MPRHLAGIPFKRSTQKVSDIGKPRSHNPGPLLCDDNRDAAIQSRMRYQNADLHAQDGETGDAFTKARLQARREREMREMMGY